MWYHMWYHSDPRFQMLISHLESYPPGVDSQTCTYMSEPCTYIVRTCTCYFKHSWTCMYMYMHIDNCMYMVHTRLWIYIYVCTWYIHVHECTIYVWTWYRNVCTSSQPHFTYHQARSALRRLRVSAPRRFLSYRNASFLSSVSSHDRPPRRGLPRPNCHSHGFTS